MKELGEEESRGCANRHSWQWASQCSLLAGNKSELYRHLDLVFKCRCFLFFALYKWCLFLLLLFSDDLMWNKEEQEIECLTWKKNGLLCFHALGRLQFIWVIKYLTMPLAGSPALQADSLPSEPQGKPYESVLKIQFCVIFLYLNAALRLSHYIIGET